MPSLIYPIIIASTYAVSLSYSNCIILNIIFFHDVMTDLLLQPLFVVIKLHIFLLCTVLCIKCPISRWIQDFRFIPFSSISSLLFLFFGYFRIITIKYNIMFFIVVILQFIYDFFLFWLYFIWYLYLFIICYLIFYNVLLILCRLIILYALLELIRINIIFILLCMTNYFIVVYHI